MAVDTGPLLLLLLALAADAAFGPWLGRVLPDPAAWSRRQCAALDRRLNKESRGDKNRLLRGLVLVVALAILAAAIGLLVQWAETRLNVMHLVEFALLLGCLRGRAAVDAARNLGVVLERDGLAAARDAAVPLTRRHAFALDTYGVVRVAVEHIARALVRRLVAPVFWYVLLGLPGVLVLAVVEGADAVVGSPGVRHERFGLTAARLDDALNVLPARLAGLLLVLAAPFLSGASLAGAWKTLRQDAGKSASLNMGWPLAAMAGALDLALAGPHRDGGVVIDEPWIGAGRARALPRDIDRAAVLALVAGLLLALLVALMLVARAAA